MTLAAGRRVSFWVYTLAFLAGMVSLKPAGAQEPPTRINVVSIVATQENTSEPNPLARIAPGRFTITRTGPLNSSLSVHLRYEGTATPKLDYEALPARVEIPAGTNSVELFVFALKDELSEPTETVVAKLLQPITAPSPAPYVLGERASARVNIANVDVDPPTDVAVLSIEATRPTTSEPLPNAINSALIAPGQFTIRRTGDTNSQVALFVSYGGTATAGADYEEFPTVIHIGAGQTEAILNVVAKSDDLVEGNESVVVTLLESPLLGPIKTYQIDPNQASATVVIHDEDRPTRAYIEITQPTNGQSFAIAEAIDIRAVAVDPFGYISRLEFYADDKLIGVSEVTFIVAPEPGTPITHEFQWTSPTRGEHKLQARRGSLASPSVTIRVGEEPPLEQVQLALEIRDGSAREPGDELTIPDYASVAVKRVGGPTNVAVTAYYYLTGTASNGVDYVELSGAIEIPAGQMRSEIEIFPLSDELVEGEETVIVTLLAPLCPAIFPPPPSCYLIGEPGTASVVIKDATQGTNLPPTARIVRPNRGSVFSQGDVIEILAEASDRNGAIERLDILADGNLLGSTKTNRLTVKWANAPLGEHALTARALDNAGVEGVSEAVKILVRERNAGAFVFRALPDAYAPGTALKVELRAEPPRGARAYAVEDHPPTGWTVSRVSNDGRFDPATGKVKFGPFTDGEGRTLSYETTPPTEASGRKEFSGSGSVDGVSYATGGDRVIEQGATTHPADKDNNFKIVVNELTAYAAAWKEGGTNDATGMRGIPLSYVTRAGYLWKHGEAYRFDGSKPAPLCWESLEPVIVRAASGGPVPETARSGDGEGRPGSALEISIKITPPTGTTAFGVEETIPSGWAVAGISHGGTFDGAVIRWGIFLDDTARTLTYTVTPPPHVVAVGRLQGKVSFDGETRFITGRERVVSVGESNRPRLGNCERGPDGSVSLRLNGPAGQVGVLQRSSNLIDWEEVTTLYLPDGSVDYTDHSSAGASQYYRLQVR